MKAITGQAPPSRIKLKYLQAVAVLDETHSLAKAADRLNLTRAALSKTLAGLEDLLGVKLYERTASGMVPTTFGRTLARHARLILGNLRSAEDELRDLMNEHRESLAVGALFIAMPQLLPQAIALLAKSDPRCVITVRESGSFGLAAGLHDGTFDLIVGRLVPEYFRSAVNLEPLFEEDLLVICRSGHPLAKATDLRWRDVADYPWLLPPKESPISHAIQSQFLSDGAQGPKVIVEAFSIPLALGMLQSCDAMTVLPSRLAYELRDKGEVFDPVAALTAITSTDGRGMAQGLPALATRVGIHRGTEDLRSVNAMIPPAGGSIPTSTHVRGTDCSRIQPPPIGVMNRALSLGRK